MKTARSFGVILIALILFSGCAIKGQPPLVVECEKPAKGDRPGPALVGMEYGMQATPIPLDSVQYGDHAASKSIAVQRIFAKRTPGDTVQITARFVSCSDEQVRLLVRTSFLDSDQSPAEPTSAWRTVILQPRTISNYVESSTSAAVSHYLIEIRSGT
jgi:hypothetical protein